MTELVKVGLVPKRGRAQRSTELIDIMYEIAKELKPMSGRGVGYQLFVRGETESMRRTEMRRVYRLLLLAREEGIIPWRWIVDEHREIEREASWDDPDDFMRSVIPQYRRDYWQQQPRRVQIWSEKGTVRGVLAPVLQKYGVGFMPVHGYSGATPVHDAADDDDGRPLFIGYVGDLDPSGMHMSQVDLPQRFAKYGGDHVHIFRVALTPWQVTDLPSFPASDKKSDSRYRWFVDAYGDSCWELDAMRPDDLRREVENFITGLIEPIAWQRCIATEKAETESLRSVLSTWKTLTSSRGER